MANYWDTFEPGLLAGEDYWEDFTPEAPTQTGIVEEVTGKRSQPWEKDYHRMAGLVDDSGQYDAWYDPDPPPETSRPDWGTPEGYENWKTRIGLETGNGNGNGTGSSGAEGGSGHSGYNDMGQSVDHMGNVIDQGVPWEDSFLAGLGNKLGWDEAHPGNVPSGSSWDVMDNSSTSSLSSLSGLMNTKNVTMAILGGVMSGPLGAIFGGLGGISGIKSLLDGTHPALQSTDTGGQAEETDLSVDINQSVMQVINYDSKNINSTMETPTE